MQFEEEASAEHIYTGPPLPGTIPFATLTTTNLYVTHVSSDVYFAADVRGPSRQYGLLSWKFESTFRLQSS